MSYLQMIEKNNIFIKIKNKLKSIFKRKCIDMIIFDLDGTLWSTDDTTYKSTNEYLKINNIDLEVSMDTVRRTMGCTFQDAAYNYFPNIEQSKREELFKSVLDYNNETLLKVGGNVYSNVEDTLKKLKEKYKLTIVSNCADGYIEAFLETSNFEQYFDDFIAAAKEKVSKAEAIKMIIDRNNINQAIYVGDTDKDKAAAEGAGIEFIQALYGFGNDLDAKYSIGKFELLPDVLNSVKL